MSRSKTIRRAVLAPCPSTGAIVRTHAFLTERELARLGRRRIVFFCSACKSTHETPRAELRLFAEAVSAARLPKRASRLFGPRRLSFSVAQGEDSR